MSFHIYLWELTLCLLGFSPLLLSTHVVNQMEAAMERQRRQQQQRPPFVGNLG